LQCHHSTIDKYAVKRPVGVRRETLDAGIEVVYRLVDQFYGERGGRLRDPYGQQISRAASRAGSSAPLTRRCTLGSVRMGRWPRTQSTTAPWHAHEG
jgi:hypothetical protein